MCTVSIVTPLGTNFPRVGCNRDESPRRPAAGPPERRCFGANEALMPVDPVSDGTWIAVSNAGLGFALLNHHPSGFTPRARRGEVSRGTIIPYLLPSNSLNEALEGMERFDAFRVDPFRLVALDARGGWEYRWNGKEHRPVRRFLHTSGPCVFASSGLGDELVEAPRTRLFEEWAPGGDWSPEKQDAFHRHAWPERRHVSVCMWRPEALTVSYTTIEWSEAGVRMSYHPAPPDMPGTSLVVDLPFRVAARP